MNKIIKTIFYVFLPLALGSLVGMIISTDSYKTLIKPPMAPPGWIFPIVWSIIYILMGISFYLVKKDNLIEEKNERLYYFQLAVNLLWSIIFFILKLYFISCIWIILLDVLIILMINEFSNYKNISAYLNIPYLLWCLFATYLTIGIYILN